MCVARGKATHDLTAFIGPRGAIDLVRAVVGAGRESPNRAIVVELEKFLRPSREWNVTLGVVIDGAMAGVVAVHVHPPRRDECAPCRRVYHSPRRGPSSVARIRATCCVVNMNIASSSV